MRAFVTLGPDPSVSVRHFTPRSRSRISTTFCLVRGAAGHELRRAVPLRPHALAAEDVRLERPREPSTLCSTGESSSSGQAGRA